MQINPKLNSKPYDYLYKTNGANYIENIFAFFALFFFMRVWEGISKSPSSDFIRGSKHLELLIYYFDGANARNRNIAKIKKIPVPVPIPVTHFTDATMNFIEKWKRHSQWRSYIYFSYTKYFTSCTRSKLTIFYIMHKKREINCIFSSDTKYFYIMLEYWK